MCSNNNAITLQNHAHMGKGPFRVQDESMDSSEQEQSLSMVLDSTCQVIFKKLLFKFWWGIK